MNTQIISSISTSFGKQEKLSLFLTLNIETFTPPV